MVESHRLHRVANLSTVCTWRGVIRSVRLRQIWNVVDEQAAMETALKVRTGERWKFGTKFQADVQFPVIPRKRLAATYHFLEDRLKRLDNTTSMKSHVISRKGIL